jgi:signal peptidase
VKIKEKMISKIPEKHREPLSKAYHISKKIKNIVCWIVVIVLAAGIISFMFVRVSGGTPELFGYSIQRIVSGSMEPELKIGDVILSKKVDDVTKLKKGDIITFKGGPEFENNRVTHRIYVAPHGSDGDYYLTTKGDANSVTDSPITGDCVESIFIAKATFMQAFFDFFISPWGLLVFVVLLLILFFDEIVNIIRIIMHADEEEDTDEEKLSEIIERLKKEEEEKQHYNKDGYLLKHLENSKEYIAKLKEDEERNKEESEEIQKDTEKCIEEEQTSELDENESEFENDEKTEE